MNALYMRLRLAIRNWRQFSFGLTRSNFVNHKKLVAGDAIVFLRTVSGELCVGVRRATKGMGRSDLPLSSSSSSSSSWHQLATSAIPRPVNSSSNMGSYNFLENGSEVPHLTMPKPRNDLSSSSSSWHQLAPSVSPTSVNWSSKLLDSNYKFMDNCTGLSQYSRPKPEMPTAVSSFARNQARITAESVVEALAHAVAGEAFEVVYYPRSTISEFFVQAQAVRTSLQQRWAPGLRFKMAVETEDASRVSWFVGTVSKVGELEPLRWPNSPWKILQVLVYVCLLGVSAYCNLIICIAQRDLTLHGIIGFDPCTI